MSNPSKLIKISILRNFFYSTKLIFISIYKDYSVKAEQSLIKISMSRLNLWRVQSMTSQLNRKVLPLSWYQVCRMFERARIELAAFNRVDRSSRHRTKASQNRMRGKEELWRFWNTTRIQWITTWNIFEHAKLLSFDI